MRSLPKKDCRTDEGTFIRRRFYKSDYKVPKDFKLLAGAARAAGFALRLAAVAAVAAAAATRENNHRDNNGNNAENLAHLNIPSEHLPIFRKGGSHEPSTF